jgi:murein hydrolase activator
LPHFSATRRSVTAAPPDAAQPVRRRLAAAGAALIVLAAPIAGPAPFSAARGETPPDPGKLREIEGRIKREREIEAEIARRHQALREEIQRLRQQLVASAGAARGHEADLTRYERELKTLEAQERATAKDFQARQRQLGDILAALQRISLRPPIALAARSDDANEQVRTALLLRTLVPELERKAKALRAEIEAYAALRQAVRERRGKVDTTGALLARERAAIAALLERKAGLLRDLEEEQARLQERLETLAQEAKTLRDLLQRVAAERGRAAAARQPPPRAATLTEPEKRRPFAAARGQVLPPAAGRVVPAFTGERETEEGKFTRGVIVEAREGAQAVAPFDGQIAYAGTFRGYGQILIIDHGDGYLSLVIGLSRIDVRGNQWVLAGEPIGTVGALDAGGPRLYLELRHNGRPINPMPWLAASRS